MSTRENPSSPAPAWTYRMEVSPTGQSPTAAIANPNDPILLLHLLANFKTRRSSFSARCSRCSASNSKSLVK